MIILFNLLFTLNLYAINRVEGICQSQDISACKRRGDLAAIDNYLRRHPNRERIREIYEEREDIIAARSGVTRTANSASLLFGEQSCNYNHFGPELTNLVNFIDRDSPEIIDALLERIPTDELARQAREEVLEECGQSKADQRRNLFAFSRAAYDANAREAALSLDATHAVSYRGTNSDLRFFLAETNNNEVVVAFAGTQTAEDWHSNILHSGADQLEEALNSPAFSRAVEQVRGGRKLNCTGHSLGGGLAEGFCLAVLAEVKRANPNFGRRRQDDLIQITTFNALGSRGMCQNNRLKEVGAERPIIPTLINSRCGSPSDRDWAVSSADHVRIRGDFIPRYTPSDISSYMVGNVTRLESDLQMPRVVPENMSVRPEAIFSGILPQQNNRSVFRPQTSTDRCDNDPVNAHSLECIAHAIAPVSRPHVHRNCERFDSQNAGWVQVPANRNNLMSRR